MKKNHIVLAALAALMISSVPAHGMWEQAKSTASSYLPTIPTSKDAAIAQFNESTARVQRCFQGQCSKMEALKAARDLGAAALLAITAMYVTGGALKKGAKFAPRQAQEATLNAGKILQAPAKQLTLLPEVGSIYKNNGLGKSTYEYVEVLGKSRVGKYGPMVQIQPLNNNSQEASRSFTRWVLAEDFYNEVAGEKVNPEELSQSNAQPTSSDND